MTMYRLILTTQNAIHSMPFDDYVSAVKAGQQWQLDVVQAMPIPDTKRVLTFAATWIVVEDKGE